MFTFVNAHVKRCLFHVIIIIIFFFFACLLVSLLLFLVLFYLVFGFRSSHFVFFRSGEESQQSE